MLGCVFYSLGCVVTLVHLRTNRFYFPKALPHTIIFSVRQKFLSNFIFAAAGQKAKDYPAKSGIEPLVKSLRKFLKLVKPLFYFWANL